MQNCINSVPPFQLPTNMKTCRNPCPKSIMGRRIPCDWVFSWPRFLCLYSKKGQVGLNAGYAHLAACRVGSLHVIQCVIEFLNLDILTLGEIRKYFSCSGSSNLALAMKLHDSSTCNWGPRMMSDATTPTVRNYGATTRLQSLHVKLR